MNYAVVTTKLDLETKQAAQKTADELGVPLSILVKGFLKQLIRTKTVTFSAQYEIPNTYLQGVIKKAEENYQKGNTSPKLTTVEENLTYLKDQGI